MHIKALELLKKYTTKEENETIFTIKNTVEYLKEIKDIELILKYSNWIFELKVNDGLEIFNRNDISYKFKEIEPFFSKFKNNFLLVQFLGKIF
jgi:hypothetical protein